ncbi:HD domain-containing phosphohydrolase [Desulfosporosinus sp. Sb-LF]|uniref:HD domain-containing phosphohydrolase n=1 Tax=Desulfosporosinus sp. Sb-LF TaxID=2560027 RepID=UPI00107F6601|nr:HD domain-containing phosphohydrolase [Desulfosporosinus sp. Sb-LF]TGE32151.1 diguanylate cyclase [Desulfosporosinus sp. Sb-LF]
MNYAKKTETKIVDQDFHRAMSIIQREESSLENSVKDWSYWDDTFHFLNGTNSHYVDVNLQDNTFTSLNLNYMGFFDLKGDTLFAKTYGIDAAKESSFKDELLQSLQKGENYKSLMSSPTPITGLLMISGKPILISISPVTTSDKNSPNDGVIVFCKLIDQKLLNYLKEVLKQDIEFKTLQDPVVYDVLNQDNLRLSFDDTNLYIKTTTDSIKSYAPVNNVYHNSKIIMVLNAGRPMYLDGLAIINYASVIFIATFLIITSLSLLVLEFLVFRRIEKLDEFVKSFRNKKKMTEMISLPGKDEISNLATSANNMLKEIDSYYEEIKLNEERFKLIMEAINDGYYDIDLLLHKFYVNPDWLRYLGFENREGYLDYDQVFNIIHLEDRDQYLAALNDCLNGKVEKLIVEYRAQRKSGEWLWLQVRGKIVEYDNLKNPKRLIGTISDITQRKNYEAENLYLSQTDVVTTLKNRTFVEARLEKADKCLLCQSWIIMGDVNGLKLINDTFGHQEGDRLLRAIGEILRKCCSSDDSPARWGGDEFIILINDNNADYVDNLIWDIKRECSNMTGYQTPISISWGRAKKDELHTDMKAVIKLAEERMYRTKLLEGRSAKSSILSSLEQSLHEKHIETEEHTRRIAQLCVQIGMRMGLTQDELDEVALLGLLHDIGKIGIPEAILLKPVKLTTDEWEIMKTHSEIGYRIAVSTPELAHVADEILSHHERYDGTGYPQGLAGKEIPKLSRLLAIVDSYDVMTHARHYKEAMSVESAVQEVQSCSGKQFDPEMVEQFLTILCEDASSQTAK